MVSGASSMSWNAPRAVSAVGATPITASTGTLLSYDSASAGTTFIEPPPEVVMTIDGESVIRATPSAIAPAANSCLATTVGMPSRAAASYMSSMFAPCTPKTWVTPRCWALTRTCSATF